MHDFIRHQSFNSQTPFRLSPAIAESLHAVMRSFHSEIPFTACRPRPPAAPREIPGPRRPQVVNHSS